MTHGELVLLLKNPEVRVSEGGERGFAGDVFLFQLLEELGRSVVLFA